MKRNNESEIMKKLFYSAVFISVFLLTACMTFRIYNVESKKIVLCDLNMSLSEIGLVIKDAGSGLGWDMKSISPWHIVGTFRNKRQIAVVDIMFDHESYSILYKNSSYLRYNGSSIHRIYNEWVQDLNRAIKRKLLTANCTNVADVGAYSAYIPNVEPPDARSCYDRGLDSYNKGDFDQAISHYTKAIEISPQFINAYYNRALAWAGKGNYDQAITDYTKAMELNPRCVKAYNNMAWLLATCPDKRIRNGAKAVEFAQKAATLNPKVDILDTLAASFAEAAKFDDAMGILKNIITLVKDKDETEKLSEYNERLKFYEAHKPWRKSDEVAPKGAEVKTETVTPQHVDKVKASPAKQDVQVSSIRETEVKAEAMIPQQVNKGKVASAKQDVQVSSIKESEMKAKSMIPQQTSKIKAIPPKKSVYPYTIQVSSYLYKEKSNTIATELRKIGTLAFTSPAYISVKGDWYRVFIGYYGTLEETQKAVSKLKERRFIYARVVERPYAIQVGLFDSNQELRNMEANLESKKYVTYSIPDRTYNDKTRLLVGAFETEEEAARLTKKLQNEGFKPKVVQR